MQAVKKQGSPAALAKSGGSGGAKKAKAAPKAISRNARSLEKTRARRTNALASRISEEVLITYDAGEGVRRFARKIGRASPMQLVEVERQGVSGRLLKDIAVEMAIPTGRFFYLLGIPKATAEKKSSTNEVIAGAGGQAALGMVRLLAIAQSIVDNSTADVRGFDAAKWLGQWIDRPQPALGGKRPAELLDTPTGVVLVSRVLGAIESGAYL